MNGELLEVEGLVRSAMFAALSPKVPGLTGPKGLAMDKPLVEMGMELPQLSMLAEILQQETGAVLTVEDIEPSGTRGEDVIVLVRGLREQKRSRIMDNIAGLLGYHHPVDQEAELVELLVESQSIAAFAANLRERYQIEILTEIFTHDTVAELREYLLLCPEIEPASTR